MIPHLPQKMVCFVYVGSETVFRSLTHFFFCLGLSLFSLSRTQSCFSTSSPRASSFTWGNITFGSDSPRSPALCSHSRWMAPGAASRAIVNVTWASLPGSYVILLPRQGLHTRLFCHQLGLGCWDNSSHTLFHYSPIFILRHGEFDLHSLRLCCDFIFSFCISLEHKSLDFKNKEELILILLFQWV